MDSYYTTHHMQTTERDRLFEKPLTPSDVGKLNRLVIPKQHAERYFPFAGGTSSEPGEKGHLLRFEDELGKSWRFRYSYWTSSQSYVLTKGWSRFVKEKRLDAGDIVLFERNARGNCLYIGCRRRGDCEPVTPAASMQVNNAIPAARAGGCSWPQEFYSASSSACTYTYYNSLQQDRHVHAGETNGVGVVAAGPPAAAASKTVRLFGVNLECGPGHF